MGVLHLEDADEDVTLCKHHGDLARDGYPEYAQPPTAWIPKLMAKHRTGGSNLAEAFSHGD